MRFAGIIGLLFSCIIIAVSFAIKYNNELYNADKKISGLHGQIKALKEENIKLSNKINWLNSICNVEEELAKTSLDEDVLNVLISYIQDNSMWVGKYKVGIPDKVAKEIVIECFNTKHPLLFLAIIKNESHFNPYDISDKNAIGLGQIHLKSHNDELIQNGIINKTSDLFLPKYNIRAMEYVFDKKLKKANGNIKKALGFYYGTQSKRYISNIYDTLGEITALVEPILLKKIKKSNCNIINETKNDNTKNNTTSNTKN